MPKFGMYDLRNWPQKPDFLKTATTIKNIVIHLFNFRRNTGRSQTCATRESPLSNGCDT